VQVVAGSVEEAGLRRLGWQDSYVRTAVLAQPLAALLGDHPRDRRVRIDATLTDDWWRAYLQFRPVPDPSVARRILAGPAPVGLASITDQHGAVVAVGRGQVSAEWLGLSALWTDPAHRRQGLATMIMRALGHWAARHGARNVYLQVARQNTGALAAYAGLGFRPHHDYLYLAPPQA
jgi:ribosomal protein S18 acetylase RimI-like enzyme